MYCFKVAKICHFSIFGNGSPKQQINDILLYILHQYESLYAVYIVKQNWRLCVPEPQYTDMIFFYIELILNRCML